MKNLFFTFALLLSINTLVLAQDESSKYGNEFLSIGVGGRPLGMGGAYVAVVNDVTAGYWNPASLSAINYPQFSLMHDERFGNNVNYDYGSVGFPFGKDASLGLSLIRLGVDDIADTREALIDLNNNGVLDPGERLDESKIKFFNSADYALFFTYAKRSSDKFSYGANIKLIKRDIAEASAWGVGFDIGARYTVFKRLHLGANIQDITTTYLSWTTGKTEFVSPTAKLGTAYEIDFLNGVLMPAMDFDVRFEGRENSANANLGPVSFDLHAGLEYTYRNLFSIRTGYNDLGNLTLGAGVKLPKFNIDYSFAKFDGDEDLGNTHRISLMFTLESEKFQRK